MSYLLDTSVFCQPLKRRQVVSALQRWSMVGDALCAVCTVCLAEVEYGLHLENVPQRLLKYERLLKHRLCVLETDRGVWQRFAVMKARQHHIGQLVGDMDLLIAACAVHHGLTVATLNHRDFSRIEGVVWEDWGVVI